jgi:uncharacterized phosphosugar-binding protein
VTAAIDGARRLPRDYADAITALLARCAHEEAGSIREAARLVARTLVRDGLVYVFGSGHSHMLGEEAFYRAGGLARVCPILVPPYMLHEGAVESTRLERQSGHAERILSGYDLDPQRDCLVVASNSGVNALPLEVAQLARDRGIPVIAITSLSYSRSVPDRPLRLYELADVALDNHCPPGDALIEVRADLPQMGPGSTIVGAFLLNSILLGAAEELLSSGARPEVYLSANMPGAEESNHALTAELRERIPHL